MAEIHKSGCLQIPGPVSQASQTWLERMKVALVDDSVPAKSVLEINEAFVAYRDRLDKDEREAVRTEMSYFSGIWSLMPRDATSARDCIERVAKQLGEAAGQRGDA